MSTLQIILFTGFSLVCITYITLISLFTIGWFRLHVFNSPDKGPESNVTVIIAVRNEKDNISTCLTSIAVQDYPLNLFEVIVVDDHSSDGSGDKIREMISDMPSLNIKLFEIEEGSRGKKTAISLAVKKARGEWIVTTDADCTMEKHWLSTLMYATGDSKAQMLLAPVVFRKEKSIWGKLQELEFMSLVASSAGSACMGLPIMCNGANLAYRKSAFIEMSGYLYGQEFASGDDMFLMMKIRKIHGSNAIRFIRSPEAVVTTSAAKTFSEFANQRLRWVSKSRGYRDAGVLVTSAIVYAYSLNIIVALVAWTFGLIGPIPAISLLALKIVSDSPLLAGYSRFASRGRLMIWYVPLQIVYPVYITMFGALGNVLPYRWKGREMH